MGRLSTLHSDADKMTKKPNIAIVTIPSNSNIIMSFLEDTVHILESLTNIIYIITDKFSDHNCDSHIKIVHVKCSFNKESIFIKYIKFFPRYILIQIKISIQILRIAKYTDIFMFFIGTNIYPVIILSAKLMGKKTVIISGGTISKYAKKDYGGLAIPHFLSILEYISFHLVDAIVVESKSVIEFCDLEKYNDKLQSTGARYVPEIFKNKKSINNRKNIIGFIGRLRPTKGIMNFVQAIPLLLKQCNDLEFLIGGDGPLFGEIAQTLKHTNLSNKVKLTGWIPDEELIEYLNELRLLVLPSYAEGLPTIILEAMACGTPVLVTPIGGIPDLIKDGINGFIMENNSPECISKNIIRSIEYPELDDVVNNAKKIIEQNFSYEAAIKRYELILQSIER